MPARNNKSSIWIPSAHVTVVYLSLGFCVFAPLEGSVRAGWDFACDNFRFLHTLDTHIFAYWCRSRMHVLVCVCVCVCVRVRVCDDFCNDLDLALQTGQEGSANFSTSTTTQSWHRNMQTKPYRAELMLPTCKRMGLKPISSAVFAAWFRQDVPGRLVVFHSTWLESVR